MTPTTAGGGGMYLAPAPTERGGGSFWNVAEAWFNGGEYDGDLLFDEDNGERDEDEDTDEDT